MTRTCPACGERMSALPVLPGGRAMLSSLAWHPRALERAECPACGLAGHAKALSPEQIAALYPEDYTVGFAMGDAEHARASAVLDTLLTLRPDPGRVLEFGCGTGSILEILRSRCPGANLTGVEPAPALARVGQANGLDIRVDPFEAFAADAIERFDLIFSVNVMEHLSAPRDVLGDIARLLAPGGIYVQITPDGSVPGIELLFYDHISSFTGQSLSELCKGSGLSLTRFEPLNGLLKEFACAVFEPDAQDHDVAQVRPARAEWIQALIDSPVPAKPFHILGTGEMAALIACYRPDVVAAAEGFCVDDPASDQHLGRPVRALDGLPTGSRLVLAIHGRARADVGARLSRAGYEIDTWQLGVC